MGMSVVAKDGETLNFVEEDKLKKVEDLCSMLFEINFMIPIVKITTGDAFAGVLTAEG